MASPYGSPYGSQGQYPTQSSAAYGGYWPQVTGTTSPRTSPANRVVWAVVVLGLATYLLSYAAVPQTGGTGWGVRFSVLAAVVAALGLRPRQSAHVKLVTALAVMGFLEALHRLIAGDNPSWATIVIVVVNALQASAAIAALLAQLRAPSAADRGLAPSDAYAYYAQAAQQYYAANNQQPQQQPVQAHGTAQAAAADPAAAQQSEAERYALYTEYLKAQQSRSNPAASSTPAGRRTQTAQPAAGTGLPTGGPAEGIGSGTDPATGSPTQSSS
jgi:uncharacterized protein DUF5336